MYSKREKICRNQNKEALAFWLVLRIGCLMLQTQRMSGLLVSAAIFRNMDLALCLNVFGCLAGFQGWHRAREERRRARHGITYPKVSSRYVIFISPVGLARYYLYQACTSLELCIEYDRCIRCIIHVSVCSVVVVSFR